MHSYSEKVQQLITAFLSYEGKATLTSGQKLLWALNRDEEGWELSTLDDR